MVKLSTEDLLINMHRMLYAGALLAKKKTCHADLKLENYLTRKIDGKILFYLADFGMASKKYYPNGGTARYFTRSDLVAGSQLLQEIERLQVTFSLESDVKIKQEVELRLAALFEDLEKLRLARDLYAEGTVLYGLLTHQFPYDYDLDSGGTRLNQDDPLTIEDKPLTLACRRLWHESSRKELAALVIGLLDLDYTKRPSFREALEKLQAIIHRDYPGSCEKFIEEKSGLTFEQFLSKVS